MVVRVGHTARAVLWLGMLLRVRYGVCGTEGGFAGTRFAMTFGEVKWKIFKRYSEVRSAYARATRCPVLRQRMVLSAHAMSSTGSAYDDVRCPYAVIGIRMLLLTYVCCYQFDALDAKLNALYGLPPGVRELGPRVEQPVVPEKPRTLDPRPSPETRDPTPYTRDLRP
eukprot:928431-Rhodomonas_salina.1